MNSTYAIPQIDLTEAPNGVPPALRYLYETVTVDGGSGYLGHPDAVLLKNGNILVVYPKGHGRGAILSRISEDEGASYRSGIQNPPKSWVDSRETPTIYRLTFPITKATDKLIIISANPLWWDETEAPGGFNCSLSNDEGKTWSEFDCFYPSIHPIVAMSSLTQLKENGHFVEKWMGLFHDSDFHNYKTILTFDKNGHMIWSQPEAYFSSYRKIEKSSQMCEVECIRSEHGSGDELCLITRSNSKDINSLISFSSDEGRTWSYPVEAPAALNGERHKADYLPDGRLIITFRSIERAPGKVAKYGNVGDTWISEGWVAWVGHYEDLKKGSEGLYRIKIAHTYLPQQTKPEPYANADCGYCGNVVLENGKFVTTTYGIFKPDEKRCTYIASKSFFLSDVDKLLDLNLSL